MTPSAPTKAATSQAATAADAKTTATRPPSVADRTPTATPAYLQQWLGGGGAAPPQDACHAALDDAQQWALAGPYPDTPVATVGAAGRGGFDAQYLPEPVEGDGVLDIRQGVAVQFMDTLVSASGVVSPNPALVSTPALTTLAAQVNAEADPTTRAAALAAYQWQSAEKSPWLTRLQTLIETGWSGQHHFFLNRPRWNWLGAGVAVHLAVGERTQAAGDHLFVQTYRTPAGEDLTRFGNGDATNPGNATDPHDQTMTLSGTGLDPNFYDILRRSVTFAHDSAALDATARASLDRFIAKYDGAIAHAAHQEIRVDVVGHASASGGADHNRRLAQRRAEAVRDYLRDHGFHNIGTRINLGSRGADEADPLDPNNEHDRRVDLSVDGGARQIGALHEWGHAFGLVDEYTTAGTSIGDPTGHDDLVKAMTRANGEHLPGAIREHNGGIMSEGNEVRPQHYATFHHALTTVTAQSPWSLGWPTPKWQVKMECGDPSPPGDFPTPTPVPDDGTGTA